MTKRRAIVSWVCLRGPRVCLTGSSAKESRGVAWRVLPINIGGRRHKLERSEAGVWVIAKLRTADKVCKVVVTDDQGRYLLPELPMATYRVFVRGYGAVESARVPAKPGQHLDLQSYVAPDGRAAAQIYRQLLVEPREIPSAAIARGNAGELSSVELSSDWGQGNTRDSRRHQGLWSVHSTLEAGIAAKSGPVGANMGGAFLSLGGSGRCSPIWTDRMRGRVPERSAPASSGVERTWCSLCGDWGTRQITARRSSQRLRESKVNRMGPCSRHDQW